MGPRHRRTCSSHGVVRPTAVVSERELSSSFTKTRAKAKCAYNADYSTVFEPSEHNVILCTTGSNCQRAPRRVDSTRRMELQRGAERVDWSKVDHGSCDGRVL